MPVLNLFGWLFIYLYLFFKRNVNYVITLLSFIHHHIFNIIYRIRILK